MYLKHLLLTNDHQFGQVIQQHLHLQTFYFSFYDTVWVNHTTTRLGQEVTVAHEKNGPLPFLRTRITDWCWHTPSKTQYDRLCLTLNTYKFLSYKALFICFFFQLSLLVDIVTKSQWNFNIRIASVICKSIQFKSLFFYKFRSNSQCKFTDLSCI